MKIFDVIKVLEETIKEHGNLELTVSLSKVGKYVIEQDSDRAYCIPVDDDSEYGYHLYLRFVEEL